MFLLDQEITSVALKRGQHALFSLTPLPVKLGIAHSVGVQHADVRLCEVQVNRSEATQDPCRTYPCDTTLKRAVFLFQKKCTEILAFLNQLWSDDGDKKETLQWCFQLGKSIQIW